MKKYIYLFLFLFLFSLYSHTSAYAQETTNEFESCFKYYDYGKISTNISAVRGVYYQGDKASFHGTIINKNTFPLKDIILYAHVKRVNEDNNFAQNGHYYIDKFPIKENLNFLPGEIKPISFEIPIKSTYPKGTYQIQYFLLSAQGFHYGGRPFLEEDTAGMTNLFIEGPTEPTIVFDPSTLTVNGSRQEVRGVIQEFEAGPVTIDVGVRDDRQAKTALPVTIQYFSFDDALESHLVKTEQATIDAGGRLRTTFTAPHAGAFIMVARIQNPVQSMFKHRFAVKGIQANKLFINDIGITNYPPTANDRAFVCFHSPTNNAAPPTRIRLSIKNGKKEILEQKIVAGSFDSNVHAISIPLDKLANQQDFSISGDFQESDNATNDQSVEVAYSRNTYASSQKDIKVEYNPENPNSLSVVPINIFDSPLKSGGYAEYIRIYQGESLVKEAYNIDLSSKEFALDNLPAGSYTAEIHTGNQVKRIDFIRSGQNKLVTGTRGYSLLLIISAIIIMIGIIIYIYRKRKRT